jgi:hypothetical protein
MQPRRPCRDHRAGAGILRTGAILAAAVLAQSGHECSEVEQVVERYDGYTVVENIGEAAEIARSADPRATA